MKRYLLPILLMICSTVVHAQQKQVLSAAATSCSVSGTSCLINSIDPGVGGVTFTVSANASSNTLQFEASGDGGTTWVALNATPSNSSTAATSTTSTGTWQANVAGYTNVRIRMSTLSGGTSTVSIISSFASARAGGGGGGGTVTSVTGSAPIVSSGGTTPAISCPTCNTSSATIAGTAASTDVAFGTGVNTIGTNAGFTFTTGSGALSIPNHSAYQIGGGNILSAPNANLNTAVGLNAGANVSTNQNSTFVGLSAGQQLGAGNSNTAVGSFAMGITATSNSENTAMGQAALENVTSNDNTGIGFEALLTVTSGTGQNTCVGAGACGLATGSSNTTEGFQAGENLSTGSSNIIIGSADQNTVTTGSSNIVIANSSTGVTTTNSNQLDIGEVILGTGLGTPSTSTVSVPGNFGFGAVASQVILMSHTVPTIAGAGCGGSAASITAANGTAAFKIGVGSTPTTACTVTMPAATTGWNCSASDITTQSTSVSLQRQTGAESTTSVTITNFSDVTVPTNFVANDVLKVLCLAD